MSDEKDLRKQIVSHLYHMHGEFSTNGLGGLTVDQLEKVHEMFHLDDYMCPPHEHSEDREDAFVMPEVIGVDDDYLGVVANMARGVLRP